MTGCQELPGVQRAHRRPLPGARARGWDTAAPRCCAGTPTFRSHFAPFYGETHHFCRESGPFLGKSPGHMPRHPGGCHGGWTRGGLPAVPACCRGQRPEVVIGVPYTVRLPSRCCPHSPTADPQFALHVLTHSYTSVKQDVSASYSDTLDIRGGHNRRTQEGSPHADCRTRDPASSRG